LVLDWCRCLSGVGAVLRTVRAYGNTPPARSVPISPPVPGNKTAEGGQRGYFLIIYFPMTIPSLTFIIRQMNETDVDLAILKII
jgi:hypothetical protein